MAAGRPATSSSSGRWRLLALLAYPMLVIASLAFEAPQLRALGMPLLAVAIVGPGPMTAARTGVLAGSVILAGAVLLQPALALWPPGIVILATAAWFGLSLRPGSTPLIKQFAIAVHQLEGTRIPDDTGPWLRSWSWIWTLLLTVLGAIALALALLDWASIWLLWIMGIVPATIGATLVLELACRRRRFPDHPHPSTWRFLADLSRIQPRHLAP